MMTAIGSVLAGVCTAMMSLTASPAFAQPANRVHRLDPDGNGLYDDRERLALLEALRALAPAAVEGSFDANGDGKVTIEEQSQGRHPLSMVIPVDRIERGERIPWGIDIFPEWISTAYVQEDVAAGAVAEHRARGTIAAHAAQASADLRPAKADHRGGIAFAANSGQHFAMPGHRDARWSYRWCLFTFRIDGRSGAGRDTVLVDLNHGNGPNRSSPKIWYSKATGLNVQYVGRNAGGLDRRVMATKGIIADGTTWNVVVCGIRYGQMFASVNGVPLSTQRPQPPRFSGERPEGPVTSHIGAPNKDNAAWAYDALVFGLTEPSEAMVRKMTGWAAHRLGLQEHLPDKHPYRYERPVLDAEDFPQRFLPDNEKRLAWGASLTRDVTRVNAGGPRVEPQGFERVFYDDFRAYRIGASTSGAADLWVGPGFNTAVGVDAPLVAPGKKPNAYPYNAEKQLQTLSLAQNGNRWRGSAFYSVNDLGHGYTWKGPKVVRIRCMFPKVDQKDLAGGLFPAFWSYDPGFLFWRTGNRIEVDWWEFDGQNGAYLNSLSTHLHYAHLKSIFPKNVESYRRFKVYGGELTEEKSKIPGGLFIWDGQFHTWEFVVTEKVTYANVTITDQNGRERWVEIYRCPTELTYLERLDLQLDYALKAKHGTPKDGERQDLVVDWIEVLQRSEDIEAIPAPFTARPSLSGSIAVGGTVTCEPHVEGITDVRYYWFADGYPLTWGPDNTYTITAAEAGKTIRCMVKAVGARDMPEAWSDVLR